VHTTISALEGLRLYELHRERNLRAVRAAQRRGREFLLVHRLSLLGVAYDRAELLAWTACMWLWIEDDPSAGRWARE
jgi:hypothetical protein